MENRPKNQGGGGLILDPHLRNDQSMIGYNGPVELWYFFKAQDRLLAF